MSIFIKMPTTHKVCIVLALCSLLTIQSHAVAVSVNDCNEAGCYQACLGKNCTKGGTCILGECGCFGCFHTELKNTTDVYAKMKISEYLSGWWFTNGCNETLCKDGCAKNFCNIGHCNVWGCACYDCNHTLSN